MPLQYRAAVLRAAVRPGGQVIWLGKIEVNRDASFRWGSLMQEKRIRRVSSIEVASEPVLISSEPEML
jgi:S-(hydroxymethyl)glutathione dehydrogenase / alcohol dehydrogenase